MSIRTFPSLVYRFFKAIVISTRQSNAISRALRRYFSSHATHLDRIEKSELFDVRYMIDWPVNGVRSAITDGFAHFPLDLSDGCRARCEIAVTWLGQADLNVRKLLETACERMLSECYRPRTDEWNEFDYRALGIVNPAVSGYAFVDGVWFTGDRRLLDEAIPITVVELVPLDANRFRLWIEDPMRFIAATKQGTISLTNWVKSST